MGTIIQNFCSHLTVQSLVTWPFTGSKGEENVIETWEMWLAKNLFISITKCYMTKSLGVLLVISAIIHMNVLCWLIKHTQIFQKTFTSVLHFRSKWQKPNRLHKVMEGHNKLSTLINLVCGSSREGGVVSPELTR